MRSDPQTASLRRTTWRRVYPACLLWIVVTGPTLFIALIVAGGVVAGFRSCLGDPHMSCQAMVSSHAIARTLGALLRIVPLAIIVGSAITVPLGLAGAAIGATIIAATAPPTRWFSVTRALLTAAAVLFGAATAIVWSQWSRHIDGWSALVMCELETIPIAAFAPIGLLSGRRGVTRRRGHTPASAD